MLIELFQVCGYGAGLEELCGLAHSPSDGVELLTPDLAVADGLYDWERRIADVAARQPEVFQVMQTQSAARGELLENLLATLRSAVQVESTPQDLTRQSHSPVVQIAED